MKTRSEVYSVRGDDITVETSVVVCTVCDEDIFDPDYDDATLKKAYALYRSKHGILSPGKIKTIRNQYGLSQRGLSHLLGWGEITIHRYEAGGVPDGAQNVLLKMISTPEGMAEYLETQGNAVPFEERQIVEKALTKTNWSTAPLADTWAKTHETLGPSILTGYRKFDYDRLRQVIRFFTCEKPVYKTKLNLHS